MPWRAAPGEVPDPYRVWLSEIMLQQTTVATVGPYFERFLARFPTVEALAAADEDAVLQAWAGLGYYARARNLHRCAQIVAAAGGFPSDLIGLRALPGIGDYTAAAVGSIAFGIPIVPVDGNVERVTARIFAIDRPLPAARAAIAAAARTLGHDPAAIARPADFTQALFDLGATMCTPRTPACALCPWRPHCAARAAGIETTLPIKAPKAVRPIRYGAHFWLESTDGEVLLRRRPSTGLLGGMLELPGAVWRPEPWLRPDAIAQAPQPADWEFAGTAKHIFTHFELLADVYRARVDVITVPGLCRPADLLGGEALPTVMRRCIEIARNR
jgi:A/G-specific adenine glycosylase